jgi:hypothetical protein
MEMETYLKTCPSYLLHLRQEFFERPFKLFIRLKLKCHFWIIRFFITAKKRFEYQLIEPWTVDCL